MHFNSLFTFCDAIIAVRSHDWSVHYIHKIWSRGRKGGSFCGMVYWSLTEPLLFDGFIPVRLLLLFFFLFLIFYDVITHAMFVFIRGWINSLVRAASIPLVVTYHMALYHIYTHKLSTTFIIFAYKSIILFITSNHKNNMPLQKRECLIIPFTYFKQKLKKKENPIYVLVKRVCLIPNFPKGS